MGRRALLGVLAVSACVGCHTVYDTVPTYGTVVKTIKVPYKETVTEMGYRMIPPVFPLPKGRPMVLAVLPFTSSVDGDVRGAKGLEIAEELEYRMMTRSSPQKPYKLLNRTQLSAILTEKELSSGLSADSIRKSRSLHSVEGLIVGHVSAAAGERLTFIVKAVNTSDANIVFTHRFDGPRDQVLDYAVGVFYENRIPTGPEQRVVTKHRTRTVQERVKTGEKKVGRIESDGWDILLITVGAIAFNVALFGGL